jgi:hypothetical protein
MFGGLSAMEKPVKNEVKTYRPFTRPAPSVLEMRGIRFLDDGNPQGAGDPTPTPEPKPEDQLGDAGQKAIKAERARASAAEKRVAELEADAQKRADAELTETELLKKENASLTERATKAERDALRVLVASEKKLPSVLAARLNGTTKEELEEDADALLAAFGGLPSKTPLPDPSIGPRNDKIGGSVQAGRDLFDNSRKKTS